MRAAQQGQKLVHDQRSGLNDRARASAIESIEETGRRAEERTRSHRTATETDQPLSKVGQAVERAIEFGQQTIGRITAYIKEVGQTIKRSNSRGISR